MNEANVGWGCTRITYKKVFWKLYYRSLGEGRPWHKRFQLVWNPAKRFESHTFERVHINTPE